MKYDDGLGMFASWLYGMARGRTAAGAGKQHEYCERDAVHTPNCGIPVADLEFVRGAYSRKIK